MVFGFMGLERMQFILADGTRDVQRGKIDVETFLGSHIEAVHAFFLQETHSRRGFRPYWSPLNRNRIKEEYGPKNCSA